MFGNMTAKLTDAQYHATFESPMRRVAKDACPPVEFWAYAEQIPRDDFEGHQMRETVTWAWDNASRRYQHVLLDTEDKNVFMVLVVDLEKRQILGHRLLNLNREYGLIAEPGASPNGGPTKLPGDSKAGEGPPSVSGALA